MQHKIFPKKKIYETLFFGSINFVATVSWVPAFAGMTVRV